MVETPVSFFVFNRPSETARVLDVLRTVQPARLIVHADGPRTHVAADAAACREVRALIDTVDWDCELTRNYSDLNLGSFGRTVSGLRFSFERHDRTIVLEDDCVPDPSFFPFCDDLIERYADDSRISIIGGFSNLDRPELKASYFFSRYTMSWGWATWRRTWNLVDLEMRAWPEIRSECLEGMIPERWIRTEWTRKFDAIYSKQIKNGWDYQLQLASWQNHMLAIVPQVNLVQNIGFGNAATHTQDSDSPNARVKASAVALPLRHPAAVYRDTQADLLIEKLHFERNVARIIARQHVHSMLDRWKRLSSHSRSL